MSEPQAKPCPFCGAGNIQVREGSTFRWVVAECGNCGAIGPEARRFAPAEDRERALVMWNERPGENHHNREESR